MHNSLITQHAALHPVAGVESLSKEGARKPWDILYRSMLVCNDESENVSNDTLSAKNLLLELPATPCPVALSAKVPLQLHRGDKEAD